MELRILWKLFKALLWLAAIIAIIVLSYKVFHQPETKTEVKYVERIVHVPDTIIQVKKVTQTKEVKVPVYINNLELDTITDTVYIPLILSNYVSEFYKDSVKGEIYHSGFMSHIDSVDIIYQERVIVKETIQEESNYWYAQGQIKHNFTSFGTDFQLGRRVKVIGNLGIKPHVGVEGWKEYRPYVGVTVDFKLK